MEIVLRNISKEELIKLWENAQYGTVPTYSQTRQFFIEYTHWLHSKTFGDDLMNDIGSELSSAMVDLYVHGQVWDDDESKWVVYNVDKEHTDTQEMFEFVLSGFVEDEEYLAEYGITKKKKPTKKLPYLLSDIDFDIFRKPWKK